VVKSIALLALLVAPAAAGHWDIEQVDSAGWGAAVDMRWHPDGRLFLCYSDTSGIIRLASKDSIWSYEDLPQWRPIRSGTQAFDIDHRENIGVSYIGTDNLYWYALKTDTSWADMQTPFNAGPYYPSLTSLDTAGAPAICVQAGDAYLLARLQDTTWTTYTLATGYSGFTNDFDCSALGSNTDGVVWGVFRYGFSYPGKALVSGHVLCRFQVRDSDVSVVQIAGGAEIGIWAASGCIDGQSSVHSSYYCGSAGLYLDQEAIDSITVDRTAAKFDSLDRPQIAYVPTRGGLLYRYLDAGAWHIFDLQTTGVTALSLAIDKNAQPLIAYTTSEGVFLAHGVDVVGQSEEEQGPTAIGSRLTATIARNVLRLPASGPPVGASLFDLGGRKVSDLHPGANDVSRLAPGVYFVRQEPQASGLQPQAVSKVVITR